MLKFTDNDIMLFRLAVILTLSFEFYCLLFLKAAPSFGFLIRESLLNIIVT